MADSDKMDRRRRRHVGVKVDQANPSPCLVATKFFGGAQEAIDNKADIEKLNIDLSSKAKTEIASAAEMVERAEDFKKHAREAGSGLNVMEKAEASIMATRLELNMVRAKWETRACMMQCMITSFDLDDIAVRMERYAPEWVR